MKADTTYGPNSPLYASMGYVLKTERKSGRTWKLAAAAKNAETPKS